MQPHSALHTAQNAIEGQHAWPDTMLAGLGIGLCLLAGIMIAAALVTAVGISTGAAAGLGAMGALGLFLFMVVPMLARRAKVTHRPASNAPGKTPWGVCHRRNWSLPQRRSKDETTAACGMPEADTAGIEPCGASTTARHVPAAARTAAARFPAASPGLPGYHAGRAQRTASHSSGLDVSQFGPDGDVRVICWLCIPYEDAAMRKQKRA